MSRGIALLVLLLLITGIGLFVWQRDEPESVERVVVGVGPEAAEVAEEKLSRLALDLEEAWLTPIELTSLLRYRSESWGIGGFQNPEVELSGDTIRLRGGVAVDELPSDPELDAFRFLLPDTALIELEGRLRITGGGSSYLEVSALQVAGMPIPASFYPLIIDRLSRDSTDTLPPNGFALPLPPAVGSARVEDGILILTP